jgi:hypothetical protein
MMRQQHQFISSHLRRVNIHQYDYRVDFSTVRRYDLEFLPLIIRYEVSKIKGRIDSEIAFLFRHCNIPSAIGLIKTSAILEHTTKC